MPSIMSSSATQVQMCQFCGVEPRYYDEGVGEFHSFCSIKCASEQVAALCQYGQNHPESGLQPFCGKTRNAAVAQKWFQTCSLRGCMQRVTSHPIKSGWNYCSTLHHELAANGCIYCSTTLSTRSYPICTGCDSHLAGYGPFLLPVPQNHATYWDLHNYFIDSWTRPTNKKRPEVRMIYQIISARRTWENYWAYRDVLEAKGKFLSQRKNSGNALGLWHGTFRACRLGDQGQTALCTSPDCSLCSIIRESFNLAYAWTSTYRMYGPGIYTSTKSSKSDSYAKNKVASPLKAALLNSVLAGTVYETVHKAPFFEGPPEGYDSVYGRPSDDLNNDVLVVYNEDAIRPTYLVMYEFV